MDKDYITDIHIIFESCGDGSFSIPFKEPMFKNPDFIFRNECRGQTIVKLLLLLTLLLVSYLSHYTKAEHTSL